MAVLQLWPEPEKTETERRRTRGNLSLAAFEAVGMRGDEGVFGRDKKGVAFGQTSGKSGEGGCPGDGALRSRNRAHSARAALRGGMCADLGATGAAADFFGILHAVFR